MMQRLIAAAAIVAFVFPAAAQAVTPRELVERGVAACFGFKGGRLAQFVPPEGFAANGQGAFEAQAEAVSVTIAGERGEDPDFETMMGVCQIVMKGDLPWFRFYVSDLEVTLRKAGWDIVVPESGFQNNVSQITFAGFGTLKITYGVGKPNALFRLSWVE